jgi:4'-phosphopantetheinyl transferase
MPVNTPDHITLTEGARLLIWEITEGIETLKAQLALPNSDELERRLTDKRKLEYLAVRVALKKLLGAEKTVVYDDDGKPHLSDNSYHISVSHSAQWIAVMAHPSRLVGVDVEMQTDKIQKIYKRFLNEDEQVELGNGKNNVQLMLAWSAKEAAQLHIFPFEVYEYGEIMAQHVPTQKEYRLNYIQHSGYTLVYCID